MVTSVRQTTVSVEREAGSGLNEFRLQQGMQCLLTAVQALSLARDTAKVQDIVRHAARQMTGCDGATFVLRDGEQCHYVDEDAIAPLWKGRRFPLSACVSGWTMLHGAEAVIPDVLVDPRVPADVYRPTFVKSLLMVPIRPEQPIGAIGNYWATRHQPNHDDIRLLQALANSTAIALENIQLYQSLEQRVQERTQALQQAFEQIHQLSLTDELTGLYNRRGFRLLAEQALRQCARHGLRCALLYLDIDGLKPVNDELGHDSGDAMISQIAQLLRQCCRQSDVLARIGGDEFCVLAPDPDANCLRLRERMRQACAEFNASSGLPYQLAFSAGTVEVPVSDRTNLDALLARADADMYDDKRRKRQPFPAH